MSGLQNVDVSVVVPDVDGWFATLNDYANHAITLAGNTAASLATSSNSYNFTPTAVTLLPSDATVTVGTSGVPVAPTLNLPSREAPSTYQITIPSIELEPLEKFTAVPLSINLPSKPNELSATVPSRDFALNLTTTFKDAPEYSLPEVPTIESLSLPRLTIPSVVSFDELLPNVEAITPIPSSTFSFNPSRYSSSLSVDVAEALRTRLNGGTGLSPTVENAIWSRAKDREISAVKLAEDTLLSDRAGMGFSRPTGAVYSALDNMIQDAQSKIIELSREIAIKQAELEQENVKNTINQILTLEEILIKEYLSFTQLSFDIAKYKKDYELSLYNASVALFSSKLEAYKAYTVSYEAVVKTELSKLDVYKAEIEGSKLSFEINSQKIAIFNTHVDAIKASVDLYRAEIAGVSEKLQAEATKINVYSTDIQAYSSLVQAKSQEYSAYAEQIKGEMSKVDLYNSQVGAYAARVNAYSSESDVLIKKASLEESIEDLKIKKYIADSEMYIKRIQADQAAYSSAVDVYKGEAELYGAKSAFNTSVAGVALKNIENTITQNKAIADVAIQNATLSLQAIAQSHQAAIAGKSAAGSIHQAIGASALSAINVSAGTSGSVSISASEDHNYDGI